MFFSLHLFFEHISHLSTCLPPDVQQNLLCLAPSCEKESDAFHGWTWLPQVGCDFYLRAKRLRIHGAPKLTVKQLEIPKKSWQTVSATFFTMDVSTVMSHKPHTSSFYKEGGNVINLSGYYGTLIVSAKIHHVQASSGRWDAREGEKWENSKEGQGNRGQLSVVYRADLVRDSCGLVWGRHFKMWKSLCVVVCFGNIVNMGD